jgi:hypothetical protein
VDEVGETILEFPGICKTLDKFEKKEDGEV